MIHFHASDLHYCERHLEWVDHAFAFACDRAIKAGAEIAVLSGDSFDAGVGLHEPAVNAFFSRVRHLADHMPVCVLQGTYSHDRPGSLSPLRHLGGRFPVLVADRISQAAWTGRAWVQSDGWRLDELPSDARALFSFLPSVNRGAVAAAAGAERAGEATGEAVLALCQAWAPTNLHARGAGLPAVLVTHGTVNGSMTESATALVSPDHEFTAGTLFASEACAVMVGHIHAMQDFRHGSRVIAYPGSITKLVFGHRGKAGFLLWDVTNAGAEYEFVETPGRDLIEIEFPGAPDLDEVARIAATLPPGCHVRLRYSLDEEHRASVDREALAAMFPAAAQVKVEGRIAPVQRQRAAGISQAPDLADQLRAWCALTQTDAAPLVERLEALRSQSIQQITEAIA